MHKVSTWSFSNELILELVNHGGTMLAQCGTWTIMVGRNEINRNFKDIDVGYGINFNYERIFLIF